MQILWANQPFPKTVTRTIFLAGPTPRKGNVESWRPVAIELLCTMGYDGWVFVPEPESGTWSGYDDQVEWEEEALNRADCILFWVPRSSDLPGLTTNDEWGTWKQSGKVVWGAPIDAPSTRYQERFARKRGITVSHSLRDTVAAALAQVGPGAERNGEECQVPLCVWRKPEFQSWYNAQRAVGNRLDNCRVMWSLWVPFVGIPLASSHLFMYALHVNVHVAAEGRNKYNEIVLFRTDIASVVLIWPGPTMKESKVVLVSEFRSPVRNPSAMVVEVPGGSSSKPSAMPQVALSEVEEETGLKLSPDRLKCLGTKQLMATLSAHTSTVFAVTLTNAEITALENDRTIHGDAESTERTQIIVRSVQNIVDSPDLDWSTVGMILSALRKIEDGLI